MKQMNWKKSSFIVVILFVFVLAQNVFALQEGQEEELPRLDFDEGIEGKLEIGFHFGTWSLDLFKGLFEEDLTKSLSDELVEEIETQIRESGYDIFAVGHDHILVFGSSGSVYGFELRFYPGGRYSSFSLGLSIEKTHMDLAVEGPVNVQFNDGSYAEMAAVANVVLNPLFTNLSFRWDFNQEWIVSPYFVFGLGIAALNGEVSYHYEGTYYWAGGTDDYEDEDIRDIKEVEEDTDFNIPNILPLFQLCLGVRAEVVPHLHLKAEAGIWDGFILRGGIAYKF